MPTARPLVILSTLTLVAVAALPVTAAGPPGDPRTQVDAAYERIAKAVAEATDQPRLVADITGVLEGMVDYDAFSARTLKSAWPELSETDRARFRTAFKRLIIKTYAKRFKPQTLFRVEHRGPTVWTDDARTAAEVRTTVHGDKVAADVTYFFRHGGAPPKWRAYDIDVDGVSMALNWRKQFTRVLQRDGFEMLVRKIERKAAAD